MKLTPGLMKLLNLNRFGGRLMYGTLLSHCQGWAFGSYEEIMLMTNNCKKDKYELLSKKGSVGLGHGLNLIKFLGAYLGA